ncbi:MAG: iron-sulfur cluster assembly accessory protein [Sandaracinaceae bacterium]|nr:iron-sulfur cluster assembly accessory protein [Sandaracinaceae bacterium]
MEIQAQIQPASNENGQNGWLKEEGPPIRLTPLAIEMAKKAIARRGLPTFGLRLGIRGGGCSGASYVIEFVEQPRERDHVFEFDGLKVVIDPKSLLLLKGSTIDYERKLMGHGFKFINPNEKKSCGCGQSFSF